MTVAGNIRIRATSTVDLSDCAHWIYANFDREDNETIKDHPVITIAKFNSSGPPTTVKDKVPMQKVNDNQWKLDVSADGLPGHWIDCYVEAQQFPAGRNRRENGVFWGPSS